MIMKLSVIVPVYNMAADNKLTYCIDSLLNQTVSDYEIIAVDDCSTDESLAILKDYEEKNPNKFHAVSSSVNRHQGGAKNTGLRLAKGDWISFIDADDWVVPDYYEKMLRKAGETGADCVGCDYVMVDEHRMTTKDSDVYDANSREDQTGIMGDDQRKSMILNGGSLCVKIFRRSMIMDNELFFPEDIFYEDNAMGNSYMLLNKHFEYIQEPLYFYYQHDTSTVHTITTKRCEDRMAAGRKMLEEAGKHGFLERYKNEIEYSFTRLFYINTLFSYMPGVRPVKLSWVKALSREMKETFPGFEDNSYYKDMTDAEEKKLISMAQKSTLLFVIYYKLLWGYRNFRKSLSCS